MCVLEIYIAFAIVANAIIAKMVNIMKIWDLSTRIYHWLQAFVFFLLVISAYLGVFGAAHPWLGGLLSILLLWRIGWGLFGSETSRFTQFIRSPKVLLNYLRGKSIARAGHNPLGALMVLALIGTLIIQSLTGLMMTDWINGKDLIGRSSMRVLADIHATNALILIGLTCIHISTIIIYYLKGNNLISAMFSGMTQLPEHIQQPKIASNRRALAWLMISTVSIIMITQIF